MGKLVINNGGIETNKKMASIDERYGPYDSKETANYELGASGRNVIAAGLTVGIMQPDKSIKEYCYQPNAMGQLELVPKGDIPEIPEDDTDKVLGMDENGNPQWVPRPKDGDDAYGVYEKEYKEGHGGSTDGMLTRPQWLSSLKGEKGDDGADAVNPFKGWFDSSDDIPTQGAKKGDYAYVTTNGISKIWKHNGTAFVNTNETVSQEQTFNSSERLSAVKIDDTHLDNPVGDDETNAPTLAKAEDVMQLKAKLEGVTASEEKVKIVTSGEGQNVYNGYINGSTGEYAQSSYNKFIVVPLNGAKSVRWLGKENASNSSYLGWAFGTFSGDIDETLSTFTQLSKGVYNINPLDNQAVEYIKKVPEGATHAVITIWIYKSGGGSAVTMDNFYCYLQRGESIQDNLDKKVEQFRYKKNLFNASEFVGKYYSFGNQTEVSNANAKLSNKLYLEEGVTYTASNVVISNTTDHYVFFGIYDKNDRFIRCRAFSEKCIIESGSANYRYKGHITFTYKKWDDNQAYIRIQIRQQYEFDDYTQAQLEIGNEATEFVSYHSERETIPERIDGKVALDEINRLWRWKKNLFDNANFLRGKYLDYTNQGELEDTNGVLSNKLYLEEGVTYTASNVVASTQSSKYVFFGSYDSENTLLGVHSFPYSKVFVTLDSESTAAYSIKAHVKFTFKKSHDNEAYIRIMIRQRNIFDDWTKAQLEVGEMVTEFVPFNSEKDFHVAKREDLLAMQREVNVLCIGNSNSQDSFAYVPYLIRDIVPDVKFNFGILHLGYSGIRHHNENMDNADKDPAPNHEYEDDGNVRMWKDGKSYIYHYLQSDFQHWVTSGNKDSGADLISIQQGLAKRKWDIVVINVSASPVITDDNRVVPAEPTTLIGLIRRISAHIGYPVTFALHNPATSIKTKIDDVDVFYVESNDLPDVIVDGETKSLNRTINNMFKWSKETFESYFDKVPASLMFPVCAAIENANTVGTIKECGSYATNAGNPNTDFGYLRYNDGIHLQEGLPCQIAAYTIIFKLAEYVGMKYRGIIGNNIVCDATWLTDKAIPGPHPNATNPYVPAGWTQDEDENEARVKFAQMCAVMACKHPYQVTDMNAYLVNNDD